MATSFLPAVLFFGLMSAPSAMFDDKIITRIKINATTERLVMRENVSITCTLFTAEVSDERKKRATPENARTSPAFFSSYSSFEEEEEVEKEEESSHSSYVHSQHVSATSHYSEPTSAFKVAAGNTLQTLMSRVKVVNLELYRSARDTNNTEVVARYDLSTQKVKALALHTPALVVMGKEYYRETGPWKTYTTEMTVTYLKAHCLDAGEFQCFGKIKLDGKTKYATDFGLRVKVEPCEYCQAGSSLFHQNCYKVISEEADYYKADRVCKERGDHLVTISSDKENNFVTRLGRNHSSSWRNLFIGLADLTKSKKSKVYMWTNGMKSNYRHWNRTQPSSISGESCAALGVDGMWYDESCSSKLPYICEKPNQIQSTDHIDYSLNGCPLYWLEFMAACYKLHISPKTWDAASDHCQRERGLLVEIRTSKENEFIKAAARQQSISDFYIGLRSSDKEPLKFIWQSGGAAIFTDWHPGEPNGKSATCGHMYTSSLKWDDIPCSTELPFICKVQMYREG